MTVFHTNCTLPHENTGLVLSPNTRGTFNIVWACFSIFVLGTWSILHLNIPIQSTPKSKTQDFSRMTRRFWTKLKWMAVNIIAPEWAVGRAWSDYLSVSMLEQKFEAFRAVDQVPWSRTHTYFANMGGFAIRFTGEMRLPEERIESDAPGSADAGSTEALFIPSSLASCPQVHVPAVCESGPSNEIEGSGVGPNTRTLLRKTATASQVPSRSQSLSEEMQPDMNPSSLAYISSQGQAPQTNVDEENGEFRGEKFPTYIEKFMRTSRQRGQTLSESLKQQMEDLSRVIGPVDWKPNDNNLLAIQNCLEIVEMKHFESEWQRRQFLNYYDQWLRNLFVLQGDLWVLDAHQLLVVRELGIIESLPNIRKDELDDRNKGDALIKVLAIGQVVWFFVQMGTRLAYQLPTSQLEILALSFAICTGMAYFLLLDKPKDASTAIVVTGTRYPAAEELIHIALAGPIPWAFHRKSIYLPNNAIHRDCELGRDSMMKMNDAMMLALAVFGAVHCVAWDFYFPSAAEKTLWRVCSLATIALIPLGIGCFFVIIRVWRFITKEEGQSLELKQGGNVVVYSLTFVFIICRLLIIVEVCRSLFHLPTGAFRTTWSGSLPHSG